MENNPSCVSERRIQYPNTKFQATAVVFLRFPALYLQILWTIKSINNRWRDNHGEGCFIQWRQSGRRCLVSWFFLFFNFSNCPSQNLSLTLRSACRTGLVMEKAECACAKRPDAYKHYWWQQNLTVYPVDDSKS